MSAQALHSDTESSPVSALASHTSASTLLVVTRQRAAKSSAGTSPARQGEVKDANPLKRLILQRMNELDLTYEEVAARGGFPSHSTVHALVRKNEHKQAPRPETLRRLAKALAVPLDVVSVAAARSAGLRFEEIPTTLEASEDVRIVAVTMNEMTPAQRAELRRMATEMLDGMRQETRAETTSKVSDI